METNAESINLRGIIRTLKKHVKMLIALTVLTGITGFAASNYLITPMYQADATLIVNPGQNTQNKAITYDQVTMTQKLVGTYSIILKSDAVLDKVIEDLNLRSTAKSLAKNITVNGIDDTEVIQISVKENDPALAEKITEDIIRVAPAVIIDTVKAGSVEIISPANADHKPVSPNIPVCTAAAAFSGMILAVILAFAREMMNNQFASDEDIKKHLNFAVLGVIPHSGMRTQE